MDPEGYIAHVEWRFEKMPKDGTKILRWHQMGDCPIAVMYHPAGNIWIEVTLNTTWSESSFTPDAWANLPNKPPRKYIKLNRAHLDKEFENLPIEKISYFYFDQKFLTTREILQADDIEFFDEGFLKILKSKTRKSGEIISLR